MYNNILKTFENDLELYVIVPICAYCNLSMSAYKGNSNISL